MDEDDYEDVDREGNPVTNQEYYTGSKITWLIKEVFGFKTYNYADIIAMAQRLMELGVAVDADEAGVWATEEEADKFLRAWSHELIIVNREDHLIQSDSEASGSVWRSYNEQNIVTGEEQALGKYFVFPINLHDGLMLDNVNLACLGDMQRGHIHWRHWQRIINRRLLFKRLRRIFRLE